MVSVRWYSTADLYQGRYKLEETSRMGGLNMIKLAIDMKHQRKVALAGEFEGGVPTRGVLPEDPAI